jgi:ABC-type transport system involved in multi-copper enzyme maturation permease subunit
MMWLIWKEFRLNWVILALGALFLTAPYVVSGYWIVRDETWNDKAELALLWGCIVNFIVSIFVLALLGGQSIASERTTRAAEFLAYQPVSRWQILLTKLVWPATTIAAFWGLNLAVFLGVLRSLPEYEARPDVKYGMFVALALISGAALCAFAVAWCISAFQSSATFAAMGGILMPVSVLILALFVARWTAETSEFAAAVFWTSAVAINLSLSAVSFMVGTWYFLRRVEP